MHILDKIVAAKKREVDLRKQLIPIDQLQQSVLFKRPLNSLSKALLNSSAGIIAEYKRRSPSRPMINNSLSVEEVARGYQSAGVSGISILTDGQFFGGSLDDLLHGRASVSIPILRKDFIINEYQIYEAKAYGADVILLIAAILNPEQVRSFSQLAKSLKMESLLEVHNESELTKNINADVDMIGVNNRNLKTFEVSVSTSLDLSSAIPDRFVKISESGIADPNTISKLRSAGYRGFLVGEHFMKQEDPGRAAYEFIKSLGR